MMDQNKPARFLDTAYNALKANPNATNQILQAAAQGQPVGLRGLAAAAAQQSQQEAQKAMSALQQQGPQPNIIQKMASQGIMSQMDTGLPMAPQMAPQTGAPEEIPQQMMAGGGLVSFADGGNVLPPDVIEAIQSHFAEGGEVRGFSNGKDVFSELASQYGQFAPLPGAEEDTGMLPRLMREIRGVRVGRGGISAEDLMRDTEETFTPDLVATRGRGASVAPSGISTLDLQDFAPTGMYKPEVKESKPSGTKTWQAKPDKDTGTQSSLKAPVLPEATKVHKVFDEAKSDLGAVTTDQQVEAAKSLETQGLGGLERMRDLMMDLRGHKEMSPEIKAKLEELEGGARTSTILQSLLGGLAGGLSNPYGGRFALGQAALGALGGYQKGIGAEEDMSRQAFNVLRGYADAPAEEKAKAVDELMNIQKERMKLQSAQEIAESRGEDALTRAILQGGFAQRRAETMAGGQEAKLAQFNMKQAETEFNDWLENEMKDRRTKVPASPITDQEKAIKRAEFYKKYGVSDLLGGLGAGQNVQQSTGLGGGAQTPMIFKRQQ